ncbi:zinc finger matrin-type protein 1 [Amia ocellicauda]|uniref:zinc finger matrin-type protein 1 n=1 Tax=Amia ocellicauda TaxID=2972642 RepID=UPI003464711B
MESKSPYIPQLVEILTPQSPNSPSSSASVVEAETNKNTQNTINSQSKGDPSPGGALSELFTDSFCKVCGVVLLSESQRVSHYQGKKHAQKVRLYLQMKKDQNGGGANNSEKSDFQNDGTVDKNRFCELCNMVFSSPVVAQSHYSGKIHTKKMKKLGLPLLTHTLLPAQTDKSHRTAVPPISLEAESAAPPCLGGERRSQQPGLSVEPEVDLSDINKYCQLCSASFNNPLMAQQHYGGKKHQRNEARRRMLQDMCEEEPDYDRHAVGMGTLTCPICSVTLNSVEVYQAHMQGNKHQVKETKVASLMKSTKKKVYDSFQDELADYIQVQKARGLLPKTVLAGLEGQQQQQQQQEEEEEEKEEEMRGAAGPGEEVLGSARSESMEQLQYLPGCPPLESWHLDGLQHPPPPPQSKPPWICGAGGLQPKTRLFRLDQGLPPGLPPVCTFGQPGSLLGQTWGPRGPPPFFWRDPFPPENGGLFVPCMRAQLPESFGARPCEGVLPAPPLELGCRPWPPHSQLGPNRDLGLSYTYREGCQEPDSLDSDCSDTSSSSTGEERRLRRKRKKKREHRSRGDSEEVDEEMGEDERRCKKRRKHEHRESHKREDRQRVKKVKVGEGRVEVKEKENKGKEEGGAEGGSQKPQDPAKEEKQRQKREKEGRAKHRKDKRKKKDKVDGRTEEEKLWDESIMGL